MEGHDSISPYVTEAVIDNGPNFPARTVRFETGRLAPQASGAAVVFCGDTMVLSATTAAKSPREHLDFFPLTVDVEERQYAAGRIPGSFFRREGRASTDAILACRLIDRPLRPGFPKGLRNEIHVVATVLSSDPEIAYDVLAINAASASTVLAGLPFTGPVGGARVALVDGHWVSFPTHSELTRATFNMVVAGRTLPDGDVAIMMVEAEATEEALALVAAGGVAPTEEVVVAGLEAAKPAIRELCAAQTRLVGLAPAATREFPLFVEYGEDVLAAVSAAVGADLAKALQIPGKTEREDELDRVKALAVAALAADFPDRANEVSPALRSLTKTLVRQRVVSEGRRIDGRGLTDIRTLSAEVDVVPRVHGSSLFERGETQILNVATLNMLRLEQRIDTLSMETTKRYMHHYNFPPYSTGETGFMRGPKRREIGHGALAERALVPVLPSREEFPYAIRTVSEAISSNGSTSMGSVCASTLSLLNAGVPLRAPVAGIAMGLIHEGADYVTLTDILGAEDAYGDMDFKVAGTRELITALQLDTKLDGIPAAVLGAALAQARDARWTILDVMAEAIDGPDEMSPYAPRVLTIHIPVDKIGEVIGPKGKMINQIQADTGADITIEDDGTIYIGALDGASAEAARATINAIANPYMPALGERFLGTVVKTAAFGAFVSLSPGRDGLLHISKMRALAGGRRIEAVEDVLPVGTKLQVEITEIDSRGKISLSPTEVEGAEGAGTGEPRAETPAGVLAGVGGGPGVAGGSGGEGSEPRGPSESRGPRHRQRHRGSGGGHSAPDAS